MDVVLIPAYEPDGELISLVEKLCGYGFKIVVVDDGSGKEYADIFLKIKDKATVVTLEQNCGKGAALKAGMKYIKENLPECEHFITCDADGQHRPADVVRVREQLCKGHKFVLTVRQKKGKIPLRSKVGNNLSRLIYTLLTNKFLSDNQSGLRGFNVCYLDWLVKVERNNYDYEMNVLYYAAKMGIKITTIPIDAIYIENNKSSHFHPIADTIKIYRSLFALARGTLFSFAVAELFVILCGLFLHENYVMLIVPGAGAVAFVSCILLNKFIFLRNVPRCDNFSTIIYTVISYFVYSLMCLILNLTMPGMSIIISFNLVYLICIPLRYLLHRFIFIASQTNE